MKKLSKGKEVKKLDRLFSKFIRLRDSDESGVGRCCTCYKSLHWKDAHAGHFIPRGCKLTRFNEKNVNLQCPGCNTYRAGEQAKHLIYIERLYGRESVDELMELERKWKKGTQWLGVGDIRDLQQYYKNLIKIHEGYN